MSNSPIHSTGRGGAGNIGPDSGVYVDGEIVREGVAGASERGGGGEYSAARGGAGNMVPSPRSTPGPGAGAVAPAPGGDVIPEPAMRSAQGYENFHTGRGGQGNVHRDQYGGHSGPPKAGDHGSLLDKAKHAVGLDKHHHKKEADSALKNETPQ